MRKLFEEALDDYASFHRNPKNKLTHYIGVPVIVFSVVLLLRLVSLGSLGSIALDATLVVAIPLGIFYLMLNPGTGLGMLAILAGMYLLSPYVNWQTGVALFVGGWVVQFIGHHFEGQKPAFFKNAVHLLIGPLWLLNDLYNRLHLPAYQPKQASA